MDLPLALLVEDHAHVRQVVARMLADCGYAVVTAATLEAALTTLRTSPTLALLLTDLDLPDGSGLLAARAARANTDSIAIVVMSGGGALDAVHDFAVLPKPFSLPELRNAITVAVLSLESPARA